MFGRADRCTCGIGRCCGARFSVHWTFWFNLVFQLIFALITAASSWKYLLLIFTVWGPACLLALLFHEWGHISMTKCQRGTCSSSMLWPLGGFNDCTVPRGDHMQEFWIALFGPLMHIPLFIIWIIILAVVAEEGSSYYGNAGFSVDRLDSEGAEEWFSQLAKRSLDVNIMIFCLNLLLPVYPMDIATMIATVCGHFGLSIASTSYVLVAVGGLFGLILVVVGIIYLVGGDGPGVFLLLLGLYAMYSSYQMYPMIQNGSVDQHPIFQRDCFKKIRRTNSIRSSAPPSPRRSMSPRRSSGASPISPRQKSSKSPKRTSSPRPASGGPNNKTSTPGKSPNRGGKKPLPRRGQPPPVPDIEMGSTEKSNKSPKKKPPAKKKPSKNNAGSKTTAPTKKPPKKNSGL